MTLHLTEQEATRLWGGQMRHKYGVAAPEDRRYQGILYHSKAEARYAYTLDLQQQAGVVTSWTRQAAFAMAISSAV